MAGAVVLGDLSLGDESFSVGVFPNVVADVDVTVAAVETEGVDVVFDDDEEEVLDSLSSFALNLCGGSLVIFDNEDGGFGFLRLLVDGPTTSNITSSLIHSSCL